MGHSFDFSKDYGTNNNVLEDGWYNVKVDGAEYKTSKAGAEYLNLKFKTDKGRVLFNMYNIFNKSDTARNIAMKQVKEILIYQGSDVEKLKEISKEGLIELLLGGGWIQVLVGNKTDDWGTKNTIKSYKQTELDANAIKKVQDNLANKVKNVFGVKKEDTNIESDIIPF